MEQICSLTYDFIIYQAQICHFGGQILRYLAPISQKWQILVFGLLQPQFYHRIQCLGINVQLIYMAPDKIKNKSAKIFAQGAQICKYLAQNGLKMHKICTFLSLMANVCIHQACLGHFSIAGIPGPTYHSLECPNSCLDGPNMTIFGMKMLKIYVFPPIQPIFAHIDQVLSNFPRQTHWSHVHHYW